MVLALEGERDALAGIQSGVAQFARQTVDKGTFVSVRIDGGSDRPKGVTRSDDPYPLAYRAG